MAVAPDSDWMSCVTVILQSALRCKHGHRTEGGYGLLLSDLLAEYLERSWSCDITGISLPRVSAREDSINGLSWGKEH